MKKIIPFKKDIIFKTNLSEITSISLEHELTNELEDIHGTFNISGEYKIADTSINVEKFNYELPFDIKIDDKYDVSNMTIDIDDFYYEVINNNVLSVNIDVSLDKLEEKEIIEEDIMDIEELSNENREIEEEILEDSDIENIEEIIPKNEDIKLEKERCIEEEDKEEKRVFNSIFDNLDDSTETYQSYHVYIVRENDTLESIINRYGTTKEQLEDYNDLSELKVNDKIIIPAIYAES